LQPKKKEKNRRAAYNREKISCKDDDQEKILHVNQLTLFSIVSTGLQNFAFNF
jgi:hypothetical protein